MKIEQRTLASIKPYKRNPRRNAAAIEAVARSIKAFGFRQPIVVDAKGVIVCGHTRFAAAQRLGLAKVPVHVAADLTATQVRALRLADNASHELSEWDLELLPLELRDLQKADFDLSLTAIPMATIDELLAGAGEEPDDDDEETGSDGGGVAGDQADAASDLRIVIDCDSREQQARIYRELKEAGYRVSIEHD